MKRIWLNNFPVGISTIIDDSAAKEEIPASTWLHLAILKERKLPKEVLQAYADGVAEETHRVNYTLPDATFNAVEAMTVKRGYASRTDGLLRILGVI